MFESKQKYCNTYVTDKVVISGERLEKYSYSVPIMCDYEREHTPQRDSANAENGKREDCTAYYMAEHDPAYKVFNIDLRGYMFRQESLYAPSYNLFPSYEPSRI